MKFDMKYRLMLWKTYVDTGRGLTSYFNELILIFGIFTVVKNWSIWIIAGIVMVYIIICFILGWTWFHFGWKKAELEVQNQYNLFVAQMRKRLKGRTA